MELPVPTGDCELWTHRGAPSTQGAAGAVGVTQESPGAKRLWDEKRRTLWTLPCPTAAGSAPGSCPLRAEETSLAAETWGPHPCGHVTEDRIPSLLSFAPAAAKPVDL